MGKIVVALSRGGETSGGNTTMYRATPTASVVTQAEIIVILQGPEAEPHGFPQTSVRRTLGWVVTQLVFLSFFGEADSIRDSTWRCKLPLGARSARSVALVILASTSFCSK